jgi:hypothetical protein
VLCRLILGKGLIHLEDGERYLPLADCGKVGDIISLYALLLLQALPLVNEELHARLALLILIRFTLLVILYLLFEHWLERHLTSALDHGHVCAVKVLDLDRRDLINRGLDGQPIILLLR